MSERDVLEFDRRVETHWPGIKWRDPIKCSAPQGSGLGCRLCIARLGLKAEEVPYLFQDREEFDRHFAVTHVAHND